MILLWVVALVAGLAVSVVASDGALKSAEALGHRAGLSPFIIGLTIVSIGTDLPEIANSLSAAAAGRGDLNVGDSTGSTATQLTFVTGVLCFARPMRTNRAFVALTGGFTVAALLLAVVLMQDGNISHLDGLILVVAWAATTFTVGRKARTNVTSQPSLFTASVGRAMATTLFSLALVAGGAILAVTAFSRISDDLGVPEYATSFFVLSIGTSLPELIVDGKALRQGSGALAIGGLLGSSLADATLSLGIGPLVFGTDVSDAATRGTLLVTGVVAVAILVLLARREHRWPSGLALIALYLALFPLLFG